MCKIVLMEVPDPARYQPRGDQDGSDDEAPRKGNRARSWWVLSAVTGVVVLVIAVVAVAAPGTSVRRSTPVSASPFDPDEIDAARPTGLRADDHGNYAVLVWRNGARRTDLMMQPATATALGEVQALRDETTFTVVDLDAVQGRYFRVGHRFGVDASTGKSVVAWSEFTCIRGVTPPSS